MIILRDQTKPLCC